MAENLCYASPGTTTNEGTSFYYDFDKKNEEIYGRLYAWDAAMIECPPGWHLPSLEEWIDLALRDIQVESEESISIVPC